MAEFYLDQFISQKVINPKLLKNLLMEFEQGKLSNSPRRNRLRQL